MRVIGEADQSLLLFLTILGIVKVFANFAQLNSAASGVQLYFCWIANAVAALGLSYLLMGVIGIGASTIEQSRKRRAANPKNAD